MPSITRGRGKKVESPGESGTFCPTPEGQVVFTAPFRAMGSSASLTSSEPTVWGPE
jgi:hypothetical protein